MQLVSYNLVSMWINLGVLPEKVTTFMKLPQTNYHLFDKVVIESRKSRSFLLDIYNNVPKKKGGGGGVFW